MNWLNRFPTPKYTYGVIVDLDGTLRSGEYRYNSKSSNVEFVLWKKGEHDHKEDYWHRMGDGWENYFIPELNPTQEVIEEKVKYVEDLIDKRTNYFRR